MLPWSNVDWKRWINVGIISKPRALPSGKYVNSSMQPMEAERGVRGTLSCIQKGSRYESKKARLLKYFKDKNSKISRCKKPMFCYGGKLIYLTACDYIFCKVFWCEAFFFVVKLRSLWSLFWSSILLVRCMDINKSKILCETFGLHMTKKY